MAWHGRLGHVFPHKPRAGRPCHESTVPRVFNPCERRRPRLLHRFFVFDLFRSSLCSLCLCVLCASLLPVHAQNPPALPSPLGTARLRSPRAGERGLAIYLPSRLAPIGAFPGARGFSLAPSRAPRRFAAARASLVHSASRVAADRLARRRRWLRSG